MRSRNALLTLPFVFFFILADLFPAPRDVQFRSVNLETGVFELFNFGDADVALDGWQFCTNTDKNIQIYTFDTGLNGVVIEAGTSIFVHMNNDGPGGADDLNASQLGDFAGALDTGPFALGLYFLGPEGFIDFEDGTQMADYLQWNINGADDPVASNRADEAEFGGLWTDTTAWIATTAETARIQLTDDSGAELHGPKNYEVVPAGSGGRPFHRGDTTDEGTIDLTDGVRIFGFLFLGGPRPVCLETADTNNSGAVDITDGVGLLNFLFLGGAPPAPPGPTSLPCGSDPDPPGSAGDLGCDAYVSC